MQKTVLFRCPVCRARLRDAVACSRCGSTLEQVQRMAQQADDLEGVAIAFLADENLIQAQRTLRAARKLRRSHLSSALLQFIEYRLMSRRACDFSHLE